MATEGKARSFGRSIDVHHHIFPPSLAKAKIAANDKLGWRTPEANLPWSPQLSLSKMDAMGVEAAILSFPAGIPGEPPGPSSRAKARELNMMAFKTCKDYPGRFGFFACLPNPGDIGGALDELNFALDHLQADGVSLPSSYGEGENTRYIADDAYDPLWKELDRRHCVVFLHGTQKLSSTPCPHPFLGVPITEVPNETFKAAAHLVVTGKKRLYHHVHIILAHLGGSAPFLAPRVGVLSQHMGCTLSAEEVMADFKTFHYETALSTCETTLAAMQTFVGPEKLLFGTDFPAVSQDMVSWFTNQLGTFYSADLEALGMIHRQNAISLFPRLDLGSHPHHEHPPMSAATA